MNPYRQPPKRARAGFARHARVPTWLFALLALIGCLATGVGCHDLTPAVQSANAVRATGHELAAVIVDRCQRPYEVAATLTPPEARREVARLDAMHCPRALLALTDLSNAHRAQHDLIEAIQAGQCVATIARDVPAKCDLMKSGQQLLNAGASLQRAVDELQRQAQ